MTEAEVMPVRQELHWLLDHIPAEKVAEARLYLESLADPIALSLLNAPFDDEPDSAEERAHIQKSRSEPGTETSHDDVLREFGL